MYENGKTLGENTIRYFSKEREARPKIPLREKNTASGSSRVRVPCWLRVLSCCWGGLGKLLVLYYETVRWCFDGSLRCACGATRRLAPSSWSLRRSAPPCQLPVAPSAPRTSSIGRLRRPGNIYQPIYTNAPLRGAIYTNDTNIYESGCIFSWTNLWYFFDLQISNFVFLYSSPVELYTFFCTCIRIRILFAWTNDVFIFSFW